MATASLRLRQNCRSLKKKKMTIYYFLLTCSRLTAWRPCWKMHPRSTPSSSRMCETSHRLVWSTTQQWTHLGAPRGRHCSRPSPGRGRRRWPATSQGPMTSAVGPWRITASPPMCMIIVSMPRDMGRTSGEFWFPSAAFLLLWMLKRKKIVLGYNFFCEHIIG